MLAVGIFGLSYYIWYTTNAIIFMDENNCKVAAEIEKLSRAQCRPTEENLAKLKQQAKNCDIDYMLYTSASKRLKFNFFNGQNPRNEVDLYFSLMSYVQFLTQQANKAAVSIPKNFTFCFEPYVKKDLIPQQEQIHDLYKQSKIIAQLMMLLFESNEHGIDLHNVLREDIDTGRKGKAKNRANTAGTIDAKRSISVRKKNLKSYTFIIDFSTYTSDLRNFINKLQAYNLPVIIRSLSIGNEIKGKSSTIKKGDTMIMSTGKMKVSLSLEWIFIENGKNLLQSEKVARE
jgi:hypothetical protein